MLINILQVKQLNKKAMEPNFDMQELIYWLNNLDKYCDKRNELIASNGDIKNYENKLTTTPVELNDENIVNK